jgi:hypothetical protein
VTEKRPNSICHLTSCYSITDFKLKEIKLKRCSENAENIEENKLNKFV